MQTKELDMFINSRVNFDPGSSMDIAFLYSIGVKDTTSLKTWPVWSSDRKLVALEQIFYKSKGIEVGEIDGFAGPQTKYARDVYKARTTETFRDNMANTKVDPVKIVTNTPGVSPGIKTKWPKENDVESFYGRVGENQVSCKLPYDMVIAWDPSKTIKSFQCHRMVKDSFERIFTRTLQHYGLDEIKRLRLNYFGGCLNVRKMRGGSRWSMHSWGIAIDIDPERNSLHSNKKTATLAKPEYDKFWQFVYDEGMISLGIERDFDWMHFQAARI